MRVSMACGAMVVPAGVCTAESRGRSLGRSAACCRAQSAHVTTIPSAAMFQLMSWLAVTRPRPVQLPARPRRRLLQQLLSRWLLLACQVLLLALTALTALTLALTRLEVIRAAAESRRTR